MHRMFHERTQNFGILYVFMYISFSYFNYNHLCVNRQQFTEVKIFCFIVDFHKRNFNNTGPSKAYINDFTSLFIMRINYPCKI